MLAVPLPLRPMTPPHVSLAKITRPSFSGLLARERLFSRLDDARRSPVVWITGPPGSGKTTLAASGFAAFARRYFKALYQHLGNPFALVFDGYHELSPQSPLHEIMMLALSEVPAGGTVVVITRSDPPAATARLRANRKLEVVGWRDLQLTQEESNAIAVRRGRKLSGEAWWSFTTRRRAGPRA